MGDPITTAKIILEDFASEMTMDLSGALNIEAPISALDVSANAVYEVSLAAMRSVFTYTTDSLDVIDASATDLKFFVNSNETNEGFGGDLSGVNIANALVDVSGAIYTPTDNNKRYVCHDFVRYLAQELFNTHFAVDLFVNELGLLNDIRENCGQNTEEAEYVWGTIITKMAALGTDSPSLYDDASGNICCQVFRQLVTQYPDRFFDISADLVPAVDDNGVPIEQNSDSQYYLPLRDGDSIEFKLTIHPAENQHLLTNRPTEISARTYGIRLLLKETLPDTSINAVAESELPEA